jgi:hypothetical protein
MSQKNSAGRKKGDTAFLYSQGDFESILFADFFAYNSYYVFLPEMEKLKILFYL